MHESRTAEAMLEGVTTNMVVAIELIQKAIDPMVAKKLRSVIRPM